MTNKKFQELVYKTARADKLNLYDACLHVKDHYQIDDETYVEFIKKDKTLKTSLMHCCVDLKLVKAPKCKSKNIDVLF